jgi:hypothetical protein
MAESVAQIESVLDLHECNFDLLLLIQNILTLRNFLMVSWLLINCHRFKNMNRPLFGVCF